MPWQEKSHFVKANKALVVSVEATMTGMELAQKVDPEMGQSATVAASCKAVVDPISGEYRIYPVIWADSATQNLQD
eukprot:11108817-Prorocentrum_lima.AAC.1